MNKKKPQQKANRSENKDVLSFQDEQHSERHPPDEKNVAKKGIGARIKEGIKKKVTKLHDWNTVQKEKDAAAGKKALKGDGDSAYKLTMETAAIAATGAGTITAALSKPKDTEGKNKKMGTSYKALSAVQKPEDTGSKKDAGLRPGFNDE